MSTTFTVWVALIALAGCGDDFTVVDQDAAPVDSATRDGAMVDAPSQDVGTPDAPAIDATSDAGGVTYLGEGGCRSVWETAPFEDDLGDPADPLGWDVIFGDTEIEDGAWVIASEGRYALTTRMVFPTDAAVCWDGAFDPTSAQREIYFGLRNGVGDTAGTRGIDVVLRPASLSIEHFDTELHMLESIQLPATTSRQTISVLVYERNGFAHAEVRIDDTHFTLRGETAMSAMGVVRPNFSRYPGTAGDTRLYYFAAGALTP